MACDVHRDTKHLQVATWGISHGEDCYPQISKNSGIPADRMKQNILLYKLKNVHFSFCSHCWKSAIWLGESMIYPHQSTIPKHHDDLPEQIQEYYNEARDIFSRSVRGSMALLRLCVQKLCKELGGSGKSIDSDIKKLVREKNLLHQVQQSLDAIRVTGNHAVHPGQINFEDKKEDAQSLFGLVNIIVDIMITQPKKLNQIYDNLPEKDRENIAKRDSSI